MMNMPLVRVRWAPDSVYITGLNGDRNYAWLLFGPMVNKDGIKAWQFILWRLVVSWGWPLAGEEPQP